METLQQFFTQWVSSLADLLPVGYAFGAGMVSAVNPCGFAMLPAYLGLYLGARDMMVAPSGTTVVATGFASAGAIPAQVARATVVTWSVTAGFVLLFGGVGLAISAGGRNHDGSTAEDWHPHRLHYHPQRRKISHEAVSSQGGILVCHQLQLVVSGQEPCSLSRLQPGFSKEFKKPG